MAASIAIVPASGSVHAIVSACRITVSGAEDNDAASYDAGAVPTQDDVRYILVASATGEDDLVSHEFTVSADGEHVWDNLIFPATGTWTIDLVNQDGDVVDATLAVTVVA